MKTDELISLLQSSIHLASDERGGSQKYSGQRLVKVYFGSISRTGGGSVDLLFSQMKKGKQTFDKVFFSSSCSSFFLPKFPIVRTCEFKSFSAVFFYSPSLSLSPFLFWSFLSILFDRVCYVSSSCLRPHFAPRPSKLLGRANSLSQRPIFPGRAQMFGRVRRLS